MLKTIGQIVLIAILEFVSWKIGQTIEDLKTQRGY